MYGKRRWRNDLILAIAAMDAGVVYLCFLTGYIFVRALKLGSIASFGYYLPLLIFFGPFFIFIFKSVGLYKQKMGILHIRETISILQAILYAALLCWSFFLLLPEYSTFRWVITLSLLLLAFFMPQERLIIRKWVQRLHIKGVRVRNTLIIGKGEVAQNLAYRIQKTPKLGFKPFGFVSIGQDAAETKMRPKTTLPTLGELVSLPTLIEDHSIRSIFIAESIISYEKILFIMNICQAHKVTFAFVPYLYNLPIDRISVDDIEGIPLISFRRYNPRAFYGKVKRFIDFILSLVAIIVFSPVALIITIAIKLNSPGPLFFSQKRVGQNGKLFRILKFRSMHKTSSKYAFAPKDSADTRITGVGRFLRKTSLDELPQLINVLRGDMSIVGPRPEMPFIVRGYNEIQKERLKVKPGMTGLWQISEHRKVLIHENMEYDLFYIENQSFLLDVAIILRTFVTVLGSRGK